MNLSDHGDAVKSHLGPVLVRLAPARLSLSGLSGITRQLEQMSDWERGLAASTAFDHDRRNIADRILRARYAGSEAGITLWILVISYGLVC